MPKSDRARLLHMVDAAREAMRSASARTRTDLGNDLVWTLGLVKCVEIIGEAAARIGKETKERNSQIPWAQIVPCETAWFICTSISIWTRCGKPSRKTCQRS